MSSYKKILTGTTNEFDLGVSIKYLKKDIYKNPNGLNPHNNSRVSQLNSKVKRKELIVRIESLILDTVRSASSSAIPSLSIKPRRSLWKNCSFNGRLALKTGHEAPLVEVKYTTDKRRYEIIFYLLSKIYRLLQTKSFVTKRELYYEQTEVFGSQQVVNAALADVCSVLSASPWDLRVLSTSKGLVVGPLTLTTADNQLLDCSQHGGVLIPQDVKGIKKIKSRATFILVVEKDAAFQKLLDDKAHVKLGRCILITGKGEPDINTRLLLHRLCAELEIPALCLVDADPFGIEIMCTYRFGSLTLSEHSEHLAVSEVRWVGLHPTDIKELSLPTAPLSDKDRGKLRDLAARPYVQNNTQLLEQTTHLLLAAIFGPDVVIVTCNEEDIVLPKATPKFGEPLHRFDSGKFDRRLQIRIFQHFQDTAMYDSKVHKEIFDMQGSGCGYMGL